MGRSPTALFGFSEMDPLHVKPHGYAERCVLLEAQVRPGPAQACPKFPDRLSLGEFEYGSFV